MPGTVAYPTQPGMPTPGGGEGSMEGGRHIILRPLVWRSTALEYTYRGTSKQITLVQAGRGLLWTVPCFNSALRPFLTFHGKYMYLYLVLSGCSVFSEAMLQAILLLVSFVKKIQVCSFSAAVLQALVTRFVHIR